MIKILVGAAIGAVIGYITNYIAIKMLFRPLEEKRVFGIRVPFTPGLIPKEKSRIAKSVGEAVGKYLLSSEAILESLKTQRLKDKVRNNIFNFICSLKDKKLNVKKLLTIMLKDKETAVENELKMLITNSALNKFESEDMVERISDHLLAVVDVKLNEEPVLVKDFFAGNGFKSFLNDLMKKSQDQGYIRDSISKIITNKKISLIENNTKLSEVVPVEVFTGINLYIFNEKETIASELKGLVRNPEVADKIKENITSKVLNNMNPLVSMFLNAETLYTKVLDFVDGYLDDEVNRIEIVKYLNSYVDSYKDKTVAEVLEKIPVNIQDEILKNISTKIESRILNSDIANLISKKISEKVNSLSSYDEIISSFRSTYREDIKEVVKREIVKLVNSEDIKVLVYHAVDDTVNKMMNKNISNKFIDTVNSYVSDIAGGLYDKVLTRYIPALINDIKIAPIVEKQINEFEVDYAEKIIIEIADKELKSITWLGALLGAILGIISPIINGLF